MSENKICLKIDFFEFINTSLEHFFKMKKVLASGVCQKFGFIETRHFAGAG